MQPELFSKILRRLNKIEQQLTEIKNFTRSENPRLMELPLNLNQACQISGLSYRQLYYAIENCEIPVYKQDKGSSMLILPSDFANFTNKKGLYIPLQDVIEFQKNNFTKLEKE